MLYVIGGAATGKSYFTAEVVRRLQLEFAPLRSYHSLPNRGGNLIQVRGHDYVGPGLSGVYLGVMREHHPGTDGLDRVTSPAAADWLRLGGLPDTIIGEGATLATRPFLTVAHELTELLVVHLSDEPWVTELRAYGRGTDQAPAFIKGTATRAANLAAYLRKLGADVVDVTPSDPASAVAGVAEAIVHLHS